LLTLWKVPTQPRLISDHMVKRCGPPSQTWRSFVRNHALDIAATDLFVVPTVGFDLLYAAPLLGGLHHHYCRT
jgi:hypothetical protein